MSHNTTIGQIFFANEQALRDAAVELRERGVDCELIEAAMPRAYSHGQLPEAPMVLKLNRSRYDVGFYPSDQGLEAKCDLWGGDIARELGEAAEGDVTQDQAAISKLRRAYANQVVTQTFSQQGHMVSRSDNPDGSFDLEVTVAA